MARAKKTDWKQIILVVVVLAALAQVTGVVDVVGYLQGLASGMGLQGQTGDTGTAIGDVSLFCDVGTVSPDIDINAEDVENPGTAITDQKGSYRKTGPGGKGAWTTWTLGTELTGLEVGASYEFLFPYDTAANIKAKGFCEYQTWTAPCTEDTTRLINCYNDETYDGASVTFFDEDGAAGAETFAAGDVKTIKLRWKSAKDEMLGHPFLESYPMLSDNGAHSRKNPNIVCLALNSTAWDAPEDVYLASGENLDQVGNPVISAADGATTHITYCYEVPPIGDKYVDIMITLDADDTVAPSIDDTAYLYVGNLFKHTVTGEPAWGVEDNEGSYVGGNGDADEATLDFT